MLQGCYKSVTNYQDSDVTRMLSANMNIKVVVDIVDTRSCIFPIGIGGGAPWADSRASFIAAFEATDVDG